MATTIAPWVRILILIVATSVAAVIAKSYAGEFFPTAPKEAVLFQNALLLIVVGLASLERYYTKPADSLPTVRP